MKLIKPPYLKEGDTVEIIAPSGEVDKEKVLSAKDYFEKKGYKVLLGDYIFAQKRYMAGSDFVRGEDLHNAFLNPEVKAIVCARGGYGAIRVLPHIDFDLIRKNPKIFCGYSDITALSLMLLKHADLITYSAPMAQGDFGGKTINKFTEKSFFKVLSGENEEYKYKEIIFEGEAKGITWGGNLSTIVSLFGCSNIENDMHYYTPTNVNSVQSLEGLGLIPDEKFIFFVEDVGEPVYKIDKMLRQLMNNNLFRNEISGIAYGEFTGTDNEEWLKELLNEVAMELHVPAYSGFKFTHNEEKQTLPIGAKAILNQNGLILQ